MIITAKKEQGELLNALAPYKNVYIVGCGECATVAGTGGVKEIEEMSLFLKEHGFQVVGTSVVDSTCNEPGTGLTLRKQKEERDKADVFLVLSCGSGVQSVTEQVAPGQGVVPGCDSLFLGNIKRINNYEQKCSTCGECVIGDYGGLCPVTRCPKGLLNGPCGGAVKGNCEVNPEQKCIWISIYERMKGLNQEENLLDLHEAKHNSKRVHPMNVQRRREP